MNPAFLCARQALEQFNIITLRGTHFPSQQKHFVQNRDKVSSENAWNAASYRKDKQEIPHKQMLTSSDCQPA